jgi:DNA-binding response OmpR family regulator
MPTATTIVVAREDLSIPGNEEALDPSGPRPVVENRFFNLLRDSKPDVVLLDLSRANGAGVETIHKIRRQSAVPILVVYGGDDSDAHKYRTAGAANCIVAPVDVVTLNQVLQQIVRDSGQIAAPSARDVQAVKFAGMTFYPRQNLVSGPEDAQSHLTTAENRLLAHLVAHPWVLHTRQALVEAVYGRHRPATDRAMDVLVNRLRKKLIAVGETAQYLIKTEFRRGYRFVSDVLVES